MLAGLDHSQVIACMQTEVVEACRSSTPLLLTVARPGPAAPSQTRESNAKVSQEASEIVIPGHRPSTASDKLHVSGVPNAPSPAALRAAMSGNAQGSMRTLQLHRESGSGLGVVITAGRGGRGQGPVVVLEVRPDTPAAKAGGRGDKGEKGERADVPRAK